MMKNVDCLSHKSVKDFLLEILKSFLIHMILITSIALLPYSKASSFERLQDECMEIAAKGKCFCFTIVKDIQIECPVLEPKIIVVIRPGKHVMIECKHIRHKDYKLLPKLTIGDISEVRLDGCALPNNVSIASVPQRMGVKKFNTLLFDNNSKLGKYITRHHLSGLHGLQRLRLSSSHRLRMADDLFFDDSLRNITWLDLRANNAELPVDIFVKLKKLHFIELGNNHLKSLPPGVFRHQHNLQTLSLWRNNLNNITKFTFEGMQSLSDLDLSNNAIEDMQPDVFELLTNLKYISLNSNRFRSLHKSLFQNNKNLIQIKVINNRRPIKSLPELLFANLPRLKDVRLVCNLEWVPKNLFTNSSAIDTIFFAGNKLAELPTDWLRDQVNLVQLDLSRNCLKKLPENLFRHTTTLRILKLSYNQLTEIQSKLFSTLTHLETLDLSNNRLISIHFYTFVNTPNIRELNIAGNQLTLNESYGVRGNRRKMVISPFQFFKHLHKLNLSNNSISTMYQDWKSQSDLEELDLSYNKINYIDDGDLEFWTRNSLKINLIHNQLRVVNLQNFDTRVKPIIMLNLNYNPIQCDCVLKNFVQYLKKKREDDKHYVSLYTKNLVCHQPEKLKGKAVKYINPVDLLCLFDREDAIQKRCPRDCSCWLRSHDKVLLLNCSNSNLTKIPPLSTLGQLNFSGAELYLENNNIMELPVAITPGYADVTKLILSGNNLTAIDGIYLPHQLTELDIRNNRLDSLSTGTIDVLKSRHSLRQIYLSGNPWLCNCETKPFFIFVRDNFKLIMDFSHILCTNFPQPRYFNELTINDICKENRRFLKLGVVFSFFGLLLGSFVALYYKYEKEIKICLYTRGMCLRFVTEKELDKDKKYDAFISYSHKDERFVAEYLIPQLENYSPFFKLCVHYRDWPVGESIPDQIARSIDESRRTIVVLSQNFIKSVWSKMEFKMAHQGSLNEGVARIIAILYDDIDIESVDSDLKAYLKMNTYLKYGGDRLFWSKLRYAMSHSNPNPLARSDNRI